MGYFSQKITRGCQWQQIATGDMMDAVPELIKSHVLALLLFRQFEHLHKDGAICTSSIVDIRIWEIDARTRLGDVRIFRQMF
mmetsp:Transcript_25241/g.39079  ORF Transcript_25241/g.39079 Transcript_25241/m.39079 type:complete len:82 (+) Transcript_25241:1791-2036(+)